MAEGRELRPAVQAAFRAHLAECAACRAETAAQRRLLADLAVLHGAEPEGVDVSHRVLEALRGQDAAVAPPPYRQAGWAAAAAAAVGVALLATLPALLAGLKTEAGGPFSVLLHVAGALFGGLGEPLAALVGAVGSLTKTFLEAAAVLWPAVTGMIPLAMITTAGCAVALSTLALVAIGVELGRAPRAVPEDRKR